MAFAVDDIGIALAGENIHYHQRDGSLQLLGACPVVAIAASTAFVAVAVAVAVAAAAAASGLSAMVASTAKFVAVA